MLTQVRLVMALLLNQSLMIKSINFKSTYMATYRFQKDDFLILFASINIV